MRNITYTCNLCGQEKKETELVGYKWDSAGAPIRLKPHKAVNHICRTCMDAVAKMKEIV